MLPRWVGQRRTVAVAIAGVVAVGATTIAVATGGAAQAEQPSSATQLYLVQVAGEPLASYDGGVAGYSATRPAPGAKINPNSAAVRAYRGLLRDRQRDALSRARVAESRKTREYGVTFNGFAAKLTKTEAARLAQTKGVLRVWKNEILPGETTTTPAFLGLTGAGGTWQKQFGGPARAGEGVIIGDIDSGFWPENASFAALPEPRPDAATINAKWHGTCDVGVEEPIACNNKVIGARWYDATNQAQDYEFLSPRDFSGHGSHTASTAAGNHNVPATINGGSVGNTSGMAPAARLAIYKTLWHDAATGQAFAATVDLVAAIDDAVADGVDIITYSIAGSRQFIVDPIELAFLGAAAAGVFIATSAGNAGDTVGVSSVAHNSPWTTTVAASTHDRGVTKTTTLGNGVTYNGLGVGPAAPSAPLVDSATVALPGVPVLNATLCVSDLDGDPTNGAQGALDPAKVAGKIVLCQRGVNARVDKSFAVAQAGGVGMIMFNPVAGQSLNGDFHSVPSIHVDNVAGSAIKTYIAGTATPTASISAVNPTPVRAPAMAGFSSFGPAQAGGGDLLKPDITAPGVDVIAAVAPPANQGNTFNAFSGTSMSTPHIAGIAALLTAAHPDWPPAWIKSALMTTAGQTDNTGQPFQGRAGNATPLDFGSGHVRPAPAFDPGLVFDATTTDWLRYACGIGQLQLVTDPADCAAIGSTDPSDLNYPSIAVGDLTGKQTVTRRVTNVSGRLSIYTPSVQPPPGFSATVSPSLLLLLPGDTGTFRVTLTRTTAPFGQWSFGSVTWTDKATKGNHVVRSPIAVRPVAASIPAEMARAGASGSTPLSVRSGFTGTLTAAVNGLVPAARADLALDTSGPTFTPSAPAASVRTGVVSVTVPAGTTVARFATFDSDVPAGTDVDIYVFRVDGAARTPVGQSAGGTTEEVVTLNAPVAGAYEVYVDLFAVTEGTTATVPHHAWVLGSTATGNLTASPASQSVQVGAAATVNLSWTGLTAGVRYLGVIVLGNGTSTVGRTFVRIDA